MEEEAKSQVERQEKEAIKNEMEEQLVKLKAESEGVLAQKQTENET